MANILPTHHIIFSPDNPLHPTAGLNPSAEEVVKFLNDSGEEAHLIDGFYDAPERSILVSHPKNINGIVQLAKDFGQESVIHVNNGKNELKYVNGPKAGTSVHGEGTKIFTEKPENYYSTIHTVDGPLHFQHNLNFDEANKFESVQGSEENLFKTPMPYTAYNKDSANSLTNLEDAAGHYKRIKEVKLPNGLLYRQYINKNNEPLSHSRHHALYDTSGNIPLAVMQTGHEEDPMAEGGFHPHKVYWSEVDKDYRGKGLGRQMYYAALVHGTKRLTSDSAISPEAHKAWTSMKGLPGLGGKIGKYMQPDEFASSKESISALSNSRHQVFIRDQSKLDHGKMFPPVNLHDELAASEKSPLGFLKQKLETPPQEDHLDIPEHLQIQWAVPIHRWNNG